MGKINIRQNKKAQVLLCAALTALFGVFLWLFHDVYIPWDNMALVGLWFTLAMLCIGGMDDFIICRSILCKNHHNPSFLRQFIKAS